MTKIEYINKLHENGFELLGSGANAQVFAIPHTDSVIKVGRSTDEWTDYIKWSIQNGYDGKFAPKVSSLKFYKGYYVAIMERLVATISDIKHDIYKSEHDDDYGHGKKNPFVKLYNSIESWRWGSKEKVEAPELHEFLAALKAKGFANDLHGTNIMVRKDGQIVVTDPVSMGSSMEHFRIKNGAFVYPKPTQVLPHWYGN